MLLRDESCKEVLLCEDVTNQVIQNSSFYVLKFSFQNAAKYLLSEKSHCTDRLATFKALIIFHNNGVKIDTSQPESKESDEAEKVEEKGEYGIILFTSDPRKLVMLGSYSRKRYTFR